ncbi:MAG: hypothetical protein LBQ19_00800 [Synergistaceae bacterium]|jgi:hypothetical protein|nr:hypothetical protein [Synergistaceae bacterium]
MELSEKNSQTLIYPKWTQLSYEHRRQVILDTKTLHCRYVEENFNCPDGFAKDDLAEEIYDIAAEKGVPITKAALKKHVLTELTMLNRLETRRRNKGDRQCKAESVVRVP